MRGASRALSLAAAALLLAACAEAPITGPITHLPRDLTAGEHQLVSSGNRFAFALFHALAAAGERRREPVRLPPQRLDGAGDDGERRAGATRDSMLAALQLGGLPMDEVNRGYRGVIDLLRGLDPRVEFTLANSIWYRTGITPGQAFLDDTRTWFDADVRSLDFGAPTAAGPSTTG